MEYSLLNTKIPTLKYAQSSFSRYGNPLNEQHHKSEQNSFEVQQLDYQIQLNPSFQIYVDQQIKEQIKDSEQDFRLNQTTFGCKKLCQIDCLLVERYFNQLLEVLSLIVLEIFRPSNQQYQLETDKLSNANWLRNRMQHRYRSRIYIVFDQIINISEGKESNQKLSGLKYLEKNINKPKIPLNDFLIQIQQIISEFIVFQN